MLLVTNAEIELYIVVIVAYTFTNIYVTFY